jgi:hypothetical protein
MFERYQRGTNPILDALATAYEALRGRAHCLDNQVALYIDQIRRRRRRFERVGRIDRTISETLSVFGELERERPAATCSWF